MFFDQSFKHILSYNLKWIINYQVTTIERFKRFGLFNMLG